MFCTVNLLIVNYQLQCSEQQHPGSAATTSESGLGNLDKAGHYVSCSNHNWILCQIARAPPCHLLLNMQNSSDRNAEILKNSCFEIALGDTGGISWAHAYDI
jgi:hypothetical protein